MADEIAFVSMLKKAEMDAEKIIKDAKDERTKKVKTAKEEAAKQVKLFRAEVEEKYRKEEEDMKKEDQKANASVDLQKDLKMVEEDYNQNKVATTKYIVSAVREVNLQLTATQILALKKR